MARADLPHRFPMLPSLGSPESIEALKRLAGATVAELHQLAPVQLAAASDGDSMHRAPAVIELGRRYVLAFHAGRAERYLTALARSYRTGYLNQSNIWSTNRGGNYAAGHRAAWRAGHDDRADAALLLARGKSPSNEIGRPASPELSSDHRGSRA